MASRATETISCGSLARIAELEFIWIWRRSSSAVCRFVADKSNLLSAGLAVGQEEDGALEVQMLPAGMQDFPRAATGQDQQADRRNPERVEFAAPVLRLRSVLRCRICLVD